MREGWGVLLPRVCVHHGVFAYLVCRMRSAGSTPPLLVPQTLAMLTFSPRMNLLSRWLLPLWGLSPVPWMHLTLASKYVCVNVLVWMDGLTFVWMVWGLSRYVSVLGIE